MGLWFNIRIIAKKNEMCYYNYLYFTQKRLTKHFTIILALSTVKQHK